MQCNEMVAIVACIIDHVLSVVVSFILNFFVSLPIMKVLHTSCAFDMPACILYFFHCCSVPILV